MCFCTTIDSKSYYFLYKIYFPINFGMNGKFVFSSQFSISEKIGLSAMYRKFLKSIRPV